jgi:SanA protein
VQKKKISKKSLILFLILSITIGALCSIYYCNKIITATSTGKLYSDTAAIPFRKVGILLGTSKFDRPGHINPYYAHRIEAAAQLLKSGKIKYLVISGDNGRKEYSEPEAMRADLMSEGIDSTRIYLDYAGFRTFDSMIRLDKIFGQTAVTVISQEFHNERAIYIAAKLGISAIGFNAGNVADRKTMFREKLARVKVFIDFLFGTKPKFLGEKVVIPS